LFSDSQAKVSFTSLLHTFAIAMQYKIQKVLYLDFANAKSLITSSKSTERSMSASIRVVKLPVIYVGGKLSVSYR